MIELNEGDTVVLVGGFGRTILCDPFQLGPKNKRGNFTVTMHNQRMEFAGNGWLRGGERWNRQSLVLVGSALWKQLDRDRRRGEVANKLAELQRNAKDWTEAQIEALEKLLAEVSKVLEEREAGHG